MTTDEIMKTIGDLLERSTYLAVIVVHFMNANAPGLGVLIAFCTSVGTFYIKWLTRQDGKKCKCRRVTDQVDE